MGQSTAEYAVLLAVIATALFSMQIYMKRGIQGRVKDLADQISATQYERGKTNSSYFTNQSGNTTSTYKDSVTRTVTNEIVTRRGSDNTLPDTQ